MADPNQWRMNDDTKEQQGTSVRGQTASPNARDDWKNRFSGGHCNNSNIK